MSEAEEGLTGIILAGGEGSRFGMPKAFMTLLGRPVIHRIADRLGAVCDELILVVSTRIREICPTVGGEEGRARDFQGEPWGWPTEAAVLCDRIDGKGPLGGIATGLAASNRPWAFVASCDAPFVSRRLVRLLMQHSDDADVVVPVVNGRLQPLLALYRRDARHAARRRIDADQLAMMDFLKDRSLRVYTVEESEWRSYGIHPMTFTNVNTASDRVDAERWMCDPKNLDLLEE